MAAIYGNLLHTPLNRVAAVAMVTRAPTMVVIADVALLRAMVPALVVATSTTMRVAATAPTMGMAASTPTMAASTLHHVATLIVNSARRPVMRSLIAGIGLMKILSRMLVWL